MTTFLQIVILLSVAAVAILIVYLIDRVNSLQRLTRLMQPDSAAAANPVDPTGPFGELSGQRLWEALAGVPTEGWDDTAIELIRNRYGLVLRKHIEDLFHEGLMHARGGTQQIPSASRLVRTLRGVVESWIPIEHAMTVYKSGWDRHTLPPESLPSVRKSLDAAVDGLFNAVSIKLTRPMSDHLIPADPADPAMSPAPLGETAAPMLSGSAGPTPAIGLAAGGSNTAVAASTQSVADPAGSPAGVPLALGSSARPGPSLTDLMGKSDVPASSTPTKTGPSGASS